MCENYSIGNNLMICYSLVCAEDHKFDSWFANAEAYEKLKKANHLSCAICGDNRVEKAIMAPNVSMAQDKTSGNKQPLKAPASSAEKTLKELKKHIEETSENVGKNFATLARKMHNGDLPEKNIHGKTSIDEAKSLVEDGVAVIPLPWFDRKTN